MKQCRVLLLIILFMASSGGAFAGDEEDTPLVVMLDPGHGGKPEQQSKTGGAHWDPDRETFLSYYRFGAAAKYKKRVWTEESIVMWLARKIKKRLDLLKTQDGRKSFGALIQRVTGVSPSKEFFSKPVSIDTHLSRDNSYLDHPKRTQQNVNRFFRLFDSPESFDKKGKNNSTKGRLSKMALKTPDLTVCLHINGASTKSARGIHCLFVPSFDHFDNVRRMLLKKKIEKDTEWKKTNRCWFKHSGDRSRTQWMFNDTWTYFTGYGCSIDGTKVATATDIGNRHEDIQWRYASPKRSSRKITIDTEFNGPFWKREQSDFEKYRRSGGMCGYGGDNLYSGMELVNYTKMALWRDRMNSVQKTRKTKVTFTKAMADSFLGPRHRPVAADWAIPLFSNSVTAFLEVGYITNSKDFAILRNKLDVIADGIAIGIFSLKKGLKSEKIDSLKDIPSGKAIKWDNYVKADGSSYFEEILPSP